MAISTGIIIASACIVLTVLFIIWVIKRGKNSSDPNPESRVWGVNPNNMLIFAAVFTCVCVLAIILVLLLGGTTGRKRAGISKKKWKNKAPLTEQMVLGERDGNSIEMGLAGFAIDTPENWIVVDDELLKAMTDAAFGEKALSKEELYDKAEKMGAAALYYSTSEDLTEGISISAQYVGKDLAEASEPELVCREQMKKNIQDMKKIGAEDPEASLSSVEFRGEKWPCIRSSYKRGNLYYYVVSIPIVEDEYIYTLELSSDSEAMLDKMIAGFIRIIE